MLYIALKGVVKLLSARHVIKWQNMTSGDCAGLFAPVIEPETSATMAQYRANSVA